ncbi:MAG: helix-turn-helix domain-containing protein [Desulfobacter sp.]|nr:helix-turn-helix domain-containing protein [Desulfobacter sp.]
MEVANIDSRIDFSGNLEMEMAEAFVRHTGTHLFLTGKAGTGKTTFLKALKHHTDKQIMVTAPTGVAAVNAGGVTLHSFFQLPFGPCIPGGLGSDNQRFFRFSKEKKQIIKGLDLLVIDEISMVRADLLDAVDGVLQKLRRDDRPFGGVQLLLIGDLFQLPPVAKANEWQLLSDYYDSVYFFSSHALARTDFITVELKKIYRQSDEHFIQVLNQVRENRLDKVTLDLLNQCADKNLPEKGYITLTTHNKKADAINIERLDRLDETGCELVAELSGEFPAHSFPTPDRLVLKKGAQVMFLRNDPTPDKAYYNGRIGRVIQIEDKGVVVACDPEPGDKEGGAIVRVEPVEWENITYTVNPADQTIQEKVIGTFRQFPLKLAWAVTIHKSQGLTFDRAIVDAKNAFAHGQTYVALSRCRTLTGLVLSSPFLDQGIGVDPAVAAFMDQAGQNPDLEERFKAARIAFQQELLFQCFDCTSFKGLFYYFIRLVQENQGRVSVSGLADIDALKTGAEDEIFGVSQKFLSQLQGLMQEISLPESSPRIQERVQKASVWFSGKFEAVFGKLVETGAVETDNKTLGRQMRNALANLKLEIQIRQAGILSCAKGFYPEKYLGAVSRAAMADLPGQARKKTKSLDYSEFDIAHPQLFTQLKAWRSKTAKTEGLPHFQVLHQKVLVQISVCLPKTKEALAELKGVGPKTLEKYGEALVDLVRAYRREKGITQMELPLPKSVDQETESRSIPLEGKEEKPHTRQISFTLFESGMSAQKIADERGLALSTIQGHLCYFIERGELKVEQFLDLEIKDRIASVLAPGKSLGQLKNELGSKVSYGQIKAMLAHEKFLLKKE